tara:strand:- start:1052 stop:1591 length:540 start_codon:yes stop_codon:yes gene_type:complete
MTIFEWALQTIVRENIEHIAKESTFGANGYYQRIVWEIDKSGRLHEHWLGGNTGFYPLEDDTSVYFCTEIDQDTGYLMENSYITEGDWGDEKYIHPEMILYRALLLDDNIIDQDNKILDEDLYKKFLFDEFWYQESCDYYFEHILAQFVEGGEGAPKNTWLNFEFWHSLLREESNGILK